jgi:putative two-component system response regulator
MTGWRSLERSAVLVVDDDDGVRRAITRFLELEGYNVLGAGTIAEARVLLDTREVVVVLADITMRAGDNGLDLLAEVRETHPDVDVLLMTGNSDLSSAVEALKRGAYDYLRKPFPFETLRAALARAFERRHLAQKAVMLQQLEERRTADAENLQQFLVSMATIIDAKSRYTARHSARVSDLSRLLAEAMGFPSARVETIALGGRLHDIGKIGTPDAVLEKAGPLTRDEYEIMKRHPAQGDELIAPIRAMHMVRPMIRWHHENLDGQGYPDGLAGQDIPVEAFVVKVADYWEAITSLRPYRQPMPLELAVKTLRAESGMRIPADIVETFLGAIVGAPIAMPALSSG